jgi:hypothetical protein
MGGECSTHDMKNVYNIVVEKPEAENHSEDLGVDRRIILEWIVGKQGGKMWIGFIWLRVGPSGAFL